MGGPIKFEVHTPNVDLRAHVAHSLSRGLPAVPWQHPKGPRRDRETLTVVANGPSARSAPLEGATLALNGSLKVFGEQGIAPTYWACCDPQVVCADFLDWMPEETIYLVASKCHPLVFEKLKNRRVYLWHLDDPETWELTKDHDPVMCAVSITLVSIELMYRLGWRKFETWGWDGCFIDGKAHATDQGGYPNEITVEVGDKEFHTTTAWALEGQDMITKLSLMRTRQPIALTINGPGMFAAQAAYCL